MVYMFTEVGILLVHDNCYIAIIVLILFALVEDMSTSLMNVYPVPWSTKKIIQEVEMYCSLWIRILEDQG